MTAKCKFCNDTKKEPGVSGVCVWCDVPKINSARRYTAVELRFSTNSTGDYVSAADYDALVAKLAEQRQGEPIAWLNTATGNVTTSSVVVMDWDDEKENVQSLYTHADHGEVGRLREELRIEKAKGVLLDDARIKAEEAQWAAERKLSEQRQGKPAAWRGINELGEVVTEWIDGAPPEAMADLSGNPASFASIELAYTNADAGEVERPSQIALSLQTKLKSVESERDRLRAKLAERDALLRRIVKRGKIDYGDLAYAEQLISASAEPSTPAELDERAEFDAWHQRIWPGESPTLRSWQVWNGRAALERKPCES